MPPKESQVTLSCLATLPRLNPNRKDVTFVVNASAIRTKNSAKNKDGERETPNAFRIDSGENLRNTAAAVVANEI
jgi:hypothetical protein